MALNEKTPEPIWNDDLMCNWFGLLVPEPGHVVLLIKPVNSTDMEGAIKVATSVMPDVRHIIVAVGGTGEVDVVYVLSDGEWKAGDPPRGTVLKQALAFRLGS
ncbi:hypothetical protein [Mitsuaria sp. GD03876]|jgi:hypothetical protein|uniref:hypothetical protein n=1 Tax=Mitsuaria sp. GD03876 TaxID=2975399 RepID=UPI00244726EF|nr:hypothetical protein [Mitsuaria sp. GD03876]MDH0865627.1 hypothetical protein [Mitsuaria sp. GD03876]